MVFMKGVLVIRKFVGLIAATFSIVLLTGLYIDAFAEEAKEVQENERPPELGRALRDYPLLPPEVNHWPGSEYYDSQRGYAMILGMERAPKGRLWVSWIAGGDSEVGYALLAYSDGTSTP